MPRQFLHCLYQIVPEKATFITTLLYFAQTTEFNL